MTSSSIVVHNSSQSFVKEELVHHDMDQEWFQDCFALAVSLNGDGVRLLSPCSEPSVCFFASG